MGIEIERKFLLASDAWRPLVARSERMAQAYLGGTHCSTRVRIGESGAFLNIKGKTRAIQRSEFEYPIPTADAESMLAEFSDGAAVLKVRHFVPWHGKIFEIDVFEGENTGLIVAEIELDDEHETFPPPEWLGSEVSDDVRYFNVNLVSLPYTRW